LKKPPQRSGPIAAIATNRGREQQRITRMAGVRRELAEAIGQGIGVITELHDPEGHARCG